MCWLLRCAFGRYTCFAAKNTSKRIHVSVRTTDVNSACTKCRTDNDTFCSTSISTHISIYSSVCFDMKRLCFVFYSLITIWWTFFSSRNPPLTPNIHANCAKEEREKNDSLHQKPFIITTFVFFRRSLPRCCRTLLQYTYRFHIRFIQYECM